MHARGFTLLEVLIALSIFSLIGVGANHVLRTVIDTRDMTDAYSTRFSEVQRALTVIERDLAQISDRGIRDELGDQQPPLIVGQDPYRIEFTRTGWRNPAHQRRSELQRVAYSVADGILLRHYWLVLDRAEDSQPVTQKLLAGVEDLEIDVTTSRGDVTFLWPAEGESGAGAGGNGLPEALELVLEVKQVGQVRQLVDLVAVAHASAGGGGGGGNEGEGGRTGSVQ